MYIARVRVKNYKSFNDCGDIPLQSGLNVVVGQNDSGKSAFLEAIGLTAAQKPHRSELVMPTPLTAIRPGSEVEVDFKLDRTDVNTRFTRLSAAIAHMSQPHSQDGIGRVNAMLNDDFILRTKWIDGNLSDAKIISKHMDPGEAGVAIYNDLWPTGFRISNRNNNHGTHQLSNWIADQVCRPSVYFFKAERYGTSPRTASGATQLEQSAANLADVLTTLATSNPARHRRLTAYLSRIFPHISGITTQIAGNLASVYLWSIPLETERQDLSVPLADSGTGVSNVLAILYVLLTSDSGMTLVIDEPQSFLHPGAARRLFEVLMEHPQHQYIVSTHSAIAVSEAAAVLLLRRVGSQTTVTPLDLQSRTDTVQFLSEIGARVSDVFGADSVLWVEGKTEEVCFPYILRSTEGYSALGLQILSLVSTGDLQSKDAARIFRMYSSLTQGPSLMPPALAFVLDEEGRSAQEKREIESQSGGLVRWLPRRLFENYLMDVDAISSLLSAEDRAEHSPESVTTWLNVHGTEKKYWRNREALALGDVNWVVMVDAALILNNLFSDLTDARVAYDKVRHGLALTQLLCASNNNALVGLSQFLRNVITKTA